MPIILTPSSETYFTQRSNFWPPPVVCLFSLCHLSPVSLLSQIILISCYTYVYAGFLAKGVPILLVAPRMLVTERLFSLVE